MIAYFARHPTAANLLMLIIAVLGISALPTLRRETFPDFSANAVQVTVAYPGAAAGEIEEAIVTRVEDAVDGIVGVTETRAEAREGLAIITVETSPDRDMVSFQADVDAEVSAIDDFPEGAEEPIIERLGDTQPVVSIAVAGPMPAPDLKAYCELLKRQLTGLDAISLVEVDGFSDRQIQVRLLKSAMMQHDLSVADVSDAITRQSLDSPVGSIRSEEGEVLLRFVDQRRTRAEYEQLVILGDPQGGEIRLGDIAEVRDGFDLAEDKIIFDGQRAGVLRVSKTASEDSLRMLAAIREFLAEKERSKPPGVRFELTEDMTSIVQDRLDLLVVNGCQGLVLVFLTLWLFLNWRLALWVAAGLPISFLGAFFVMGLIGYSLNMMTMLGLLLALGLLMDDGIVLAENVASHLAAGKDSLRAAIDGVTQVAPGVLSSFTTTICVFAPMAFLEGDIGRVLLVLPVVLVVVLVVSLIEAFLILPNHLGHSLHGHERAAPSRFRRRFDAGFERARERGLGRLIDVAVRWRYVTVAAVISVFLLCVGLLSGGLLKFQGFPEIEGDVLQARILMPQGTALEKTEDVVARMSAAIARVGEQLQDRQPDGQALVRHTSVAFSVNKDAGESGPHVATVSVDLLSAELRDAPLDEVTRRWSEEAGILSDTISITYAEPSLGPAGRPIEIRVQGDDLERLRAASREIQRFFGRFAGVSDLTDDLRPGKPEVRMRMRPGATSTQLTTSGIADQLRAAFQGRTAREIQLGTESYEIDVALAGHEARDLGDLEYFQVEAGSQRIPLGAVVAFDPGRGWARIAHIDGRRTVTVTGDIDTSWANAAELITAFERDLLPTLTETYPDVRISAAGENAETATTMGSMIQGLTLGLFGVFALLSFQFRSYIEPLVVMIAIPLAFIGVVFGHILMGSPLSMPSMLGFVSLGGIVVNDSILLVEFIKAGVREGQSPSEAARQASRQRFRAILLTSLTTVAGLTPLLAERSSQAQVLIPMAISIVFGILASTVLVLIVVPCLYAILGDFGLRQVSHDVG